MICELKGYSEKELVEIIGKYKEYKDIEEELGIDLTTLFKALKNGIYMKTQNFSFVFVKNPKIAGYKNGWKLLAYGSVFSLHTYGKYWALTREELL